MIEPLFNWVTRFMFLVIAAILILLALLMVITAGTQLITGALAGEVGILNLMNSVGLIVVSLAIVDLGKFVVEENITRDRELRSPFEAMSSLTKFMSIIIIAISLEAVVGLFEAGREKIFSDLVYPAFVMITAVIAMVGLGAFQVLSLRAQRGKDVDKSAEQEAG